MQLAQVWFSSDQPLHPILPLLATCTLLLQCGVMLMLHYIRQTYCWLDSDFPQLFSFRIFILSELFTCGLWDLILVSKFSFQKKIAHFPVLHTIDIDKCVFLLPLLCHHPYVKICVFKIYGVCLYYIHPLLIGEIFQTSFHSSLFIKECALCFISFLYP